MASVSVLMSQKATAATVRLRGSDLRCQEIEARVRSLSTGSGPSLFEQAQEGDDLHLKLIMRGGEAGLGLGKRPLLVPNGC